jgi:hypothetical protein
MSGPSIPRVELATVTCALVVALAPSTQAQAPDTSSAKIVPVQVTGDDASRFTMVVLADGYTAADMPQFRRDLDKHLNIQWSLEPFRSYRNYFNVYAVEAVSADSGISCDPLLLQEPSMDPALRKQLQQRNTAFGLSFGGDCTNVNARGVTPASGFQARVREAAARATPNPDQILVIGNSRSYGGIGGGIATSTGSNALSPLITPHEIGHSLGRLTDEYTYSARGRAGGTYSGTEPGSAHTTLLTEEEMKTQQKKWWRWLGEPSEAGGLIGRFEGGSGNTKGIWRPSKHSMMISLGYFFDQVSLEQMVRQISARVGLIAASTPTDKPVNRGRTIWIDPAHPVYHELIVEWRVGGRVIPNPKNLPYLDLMKAGLAEGGQTVAVTVVDPTEFVRDPEIRKTVMTATRTWTVSAEVASFVDRAAPPEIESSTQTERPIGAADVVFVNTRATDFVWTLDNVAIPDAANRPSLNLASTKLPPGTHRLSVTTEVRKAVAPAAANTRRWTIDNTMPTVAYALSKPVATLPLQAAGRRGAGGLADPEEPHAFMRDEFTMKLDPKDDQPGYVVAEFRVNGDGWHHYYGWPDAPPATPFKFTARGTNIKELIYGSLGSEGLSPQPWEPREPGWGTHRIEYRAKDAAGNIGGAKAFRVTVMPSPACTATVTGPRSGDVRVGSGVTCLNDATVTGSVAVGAGASVVVTNSRISGSLTASGAATVELVRASVAGAMNVTGTTGRVTIFGATIGRAATVSDSTMTGAPLVTGSTFKGGLACTGNAVAPSNGGNRNVITGPSAGQCGGL